MEIKCIRSQYTGIWAYSSGMEIRYIEEILIGIILGHGLPTNLPADGRICQYTHI